ncbi:phage terminase small subunit P27 family [Aestuariivirga sp.]|uniref:phage terminase small subunit P27 family n=1 Tax=Aestuariivirga sp. TaxID=2650926 RepID=UPI003BAB863D
MKGTKPQIRVDAKAIARTPRPPAWLSQHARAEWRRIMPHLVERRILTDADLAMVEGFCIATSRVREVEDLMRSGDMLDPKLWRVQNQALQTARQIAAELGLTPVSRSRPTIRDDDQSDNEFDL